MNIPVIWKPRLHQEVFYSLKGEKKSAA